MLVEQAQLLTGTGHKMLTYVQSEKLLKGRLAIS